MKTTNEFLSKIKIVLISNIDQMFNDKVNNNVMLISFYIDKHTFFLFYKSNYFFYSNKSTKFAV